MRAGGTTTKQTFALVGGALVCRGIVAIKANGVVMGKSIAISVVQS